MTEYQNKFWTEQLQDRTNAIVINGNHYRFGSSNVKSNANGFGGVNFRIRLHDTGEIIETCDLWHQGEIPAEFRQLLPNNASWVRTIKVTFQD
jgi:hypothetical protein